MASTSFGWKNKRSKVLDRSKLKSQKAFAEQVQVDEGAVNSEEVDWLHNVPVKKQRMHLEDATLKAKRLKDEGVTLAEHERYWEAISKWDELLELVGADEKVLEMKAQALMALNELYPAVNTAKLAVSNNPRWWIGWQTLGRSLLNMGEIQAAIVSFQKAIHINPAEKAIWDEDLLWTVKLFEDIVDKGKDMTSDELSFHVRECMRVGIM